MATTAFTSPVSGLWPLGQITVATAGTPVALNTNVGVQTQPTSVDGSGNVRQLILFAGSNTGLTYILRRVSGKTVTKATTNFIVAVVWPGQTISLPLGSVGLSSSLNVDDYFVDADTAGNSVIATAVVG